MNISIYISAQHTCTHRYTHLAYKTLSSTYIICMHYGICMRVDTHMRVLLIQNTHLPIACICVLYVYVCACVCIHMYTHVYTSRSLSSVKDT
jgi:hypothetical protein